jgi:hypothetical protein
MKIIYLPLDSRPCNFKFPSQLGAIANLSLNLPSKNILGDFFQAADIPSVFQWLFPLTNIDSLLIMLDLIAFGGLVPSRKNLITYQQASSNLKTLQELQQKNPAAKIFAGNILTRLSSKISNEVRQRNHEINLLSLFFTAEKNINFLVIGQEDCKTEGIHRLEQNKLNEFITMKRLQNRALLIDGCDELAMMLLARLLSEKYNFHPKIYKSYSFDGGENIIAMYEDRTIDQTISEHILAVGAEEVLNAEEADIILMVNLPEEKQGDVFLHEKINYIKPSFFKSFLNKMNSFLEGRRDIIFADCRYANGADDYLLYAFSQELDLFKFSSFAAWNTCSNTVGTVLAHGLIVSLAKKNKIFDEKLHRNFLFSRFLDDWLYQSRVRLKIRNLLIKMGEDFSLPLKEKALKIAQEVLELEMRQEAEKLFGSSMNFKVDFPWGRIFEIDLDFQQYFYENRYL